MNKRNIIQFGDFQTPIELSQKICNLVKKYNFFPETIIEPTCGKGNILIEAIKCFPNYKNAIGLEINKNYCDELSNKLKDKKNITIINENFFDFDWNNIIKNVNGSTLIIGNPPWVTNSGLGAINSNNLPKKENFKKLRGIEAVTGKSNFDISEYIILKLFDLFYNKDVFISFLCKTIVARNILLFLWNNNIKIELKLLLINTLLSASPVCLKTYELELVTLNTIDIAAFDVFTVVGTVVNDTVGRLLSTLIDVIAVAVPVLLWAPNADVPFI